MPKADDAVAHRQREDAPSQASTADDADRATETPAARALREERQRLLHDSDLLVDFMLKMGWII